jgi:hypothetical protein
MKEFESVCHEIISLVDEWEPKLNSLPHDVITFRRNSQNRTIREILGHMVDSASNNTHRIIHMQYQENPLIYPDYANLGNNDRWIKIQNYQHEDWPILIQLWKYINIHITHVIRNINQDKLKNYWLNALNERVTLEEMIIDYPRHLKLHLEEIQELIDAKE